MTKVRLIENREKTVHLGKDTVKKETEMRGENFQAWEIQKSSKNMEFPTKKKDKKNRYFEGKLATISSSSKSKFFSKIFFFSK